MLACYLYVVWQATAGMSEKRGVTLAGLPPFPQQASEAGVRITEFPGTTCLRFSPLVTRAHCISLLLLHFSTLSRTVLQCSVVYCPSSVTHLSLYFPPRKNRTLHLDLHSLFRNSSYPFSASHFSNHFLLFLLYLYSILCTLHSLY